MINAGWCEEFQDFCEWLEEAGLATDYLPEWPGRAPVRVVATPGVLFLERVGRREYREFQRMAARGQTRLRVVPKQRLGTMHALRLTGVDAAKMRTWQVNNARCN